MSHFLENATRRMNELIEHRNRLANELAGIEGQLQGIHEALTIYHDLLSNSDPEPQSGTQGNRRNRQGRIQGAPHPETTPWWAKALEILKGAPVHGMTTPELEEQLLTHGFKMRSTTIQMTLARACNEGLLERPSYGYYRFPDTGNDPSQIDASTIEPNGAMDASPS